MTIEQTDPTEQLRARARTLESTLDSLRTATSLSSVIDTMEDIDSQLDTLPGQLARLRNRGYVFKNHLEADIEAVRFDWPTVRPRVEMEADSQRRQMTWQMDDLQSRFTAARSLIESDPAQAAAALSAVESAAQNLQKSANSTSSTLSGMYDALQSRLNQVQNDVRQIERILDLVDQASFKLYPEENVVDTIEAQWMTDQKGGPKGILYCTDHRLLFEQKEEIATKKVLFVVTEKQKVQQLALEAPIGAVLEIKESESGALLFRKDHLDLTFGPASKVRAAHFILKGDSAAWQRLINRINAGELERERVKVEGAAQADKSKTMPTQCPACGARITQTLVRGMTSIKCQYCGTVIPL